MSVNINIYFYLGILEQLNSSFRYPRRHSFPRLNKLDLLRDPGSENQEREKEWKWEKAWSHPESGEMNAPKLCILRFGGISRFQRMFVCMRNSCRLYWVLIMPTRHTFRWGAGHRCTDFLSRKRVVRPAKLIFLETSTAGKAFPNNKLSLVRLAYKGGRGRL